jgi:hypothetical protein
MWLGKALRRQQMQNQIDAIAASRKTKKEEQKPANESDVCEFACHCPSLCTCLLAWSNKTALQPGAQSVACRGVYAGMYVTRASMCYFSG